MMPNKIGNHEERPIWSTASNRKSTLPPTTTKLPTTTSTLPPTTSTLPPTTSTLSPRTPFSLTKARPFIPNYDMLAQVGEICTTVYNTRGSCVDLYMCSPFKALLPKARFVLEIQALLRKAACGFRGRIPQVCCPIEENSIMMPKTIRNREKRPIWSTASYRKSTLPPTTTKLPTTTSTLPPTTSTLPPTTSTLSPRTPFSLTKARPFIPNYDMLAQVGEICTTVYNTRGSCMDLYMCSPFKALLPQAKFVLEIQALLRKAACGFRGQIPQVCCPLPLQSTDETTTIAASFPWSTSFEKPQYNEEFLTALPEPPVCGLSNAGLDRIAGGLPAKLSVFPWMALLGYKDLLIAQGFRWNCGGALVSKRHVLTAAHCIHKYEGDLFLVRLGELDIARDDDGASPIDVPIKTMYKHEQYTRNNPLFNDIGVLVLERDVQFTTLIKPICLFGASTSQWRAETFENYTPFVAGWGDIQWESRRRATHLQVAQVPVLENDVCEEAFSGRYKPALRSLFSQETMCAGYPGGKIDSCSGDSGGPLMQPLELEGRKGRTPQIYMYAIGVVSLGMKCAVAGNPGLYTRVSYYMPWIESKILGRAI